jgi:uncharacterized protein
MMKSQVSLLALMCMIVSLTLPAWSMEEEDQEDHTISTTLMDMPEHIKEQIYSFVTSPKDLGALLLLNKETHHIVNKTILNSSEKKFAILESAAHQGDKKSQWEVARGFVAEDVDGKENKEQNWERALPWLRLAAEQNHPLAQFHLFRAYGFGHAKHETQSKWEIANFWLTKAASNGSSEAQYQLGRAYEIGIRELIPNQQKAMRYYTLAAEQNYPLAQVRLGELYKKRYEVHASELDREMAMTWLIKAAENGYSHARRELAKAYIEGLSNEAGAPEFRQTAHWMAMHVLNDEDLDDEGYITYPERFFLGAFYESGNGIIQDYAKACHWYKLSARRGFADAQKRLQGILPANFSTEL